MTLTRPATRDDLASIARVIAETDMFPLELLEGMMAPYLADPSGGERWLVHDEGEGAVAVAYHAPERLTRGTWNLLCIAVLPERQGRGVGASLLAAVEAALADAGERVLLVETSGSTSFARTRAFYRARGYHEEATLRDYYDAGEDKVIFRKDLRRGASVEIREARAADLPRIVQLARALGVQHEAYDPTRFELGAFGEATELEATYVRFFEEAIADDASLVLVAVGQERVTGYVFARLEPSSFLDLASASGWIHDVYVDDEARGVGLGRRLVASALRALEARGASRFRLTASPRNNHALATFEALGFRPTMIEMQRDGDGITTGGDRDHHQG